ncbi:protein kinase [Planctomycetota bacterium]
MSGTVLSSGDVLPGGFRLERAIGVGAFSLVWQATQLQTDRTYAVKIAKKACYLPLLRRQTRLPLHPGIVQVHSIQDSTEPYYLALEFVDGASLRLVLRKRYANGLPVATALRLVFEIAGAISAAHDAGIAHGDLKPENILVSHKHAVKVTDFGVIRTHAEAELQNSLSTMQAAPYTPAYVAPEVLQGQAATSPATDIYALGAILHEVLTGQPPAGASLPSHLNPSVPLQVDQLFQRLYAVADRRIADMKSVCAALSNALAEVSETPASPGGPLAQCQANLSEAQQANSVDDTAVPPQAASEAGIGFTWRFRHALGAGAGLAILLITVLVVFFRPSGTEPKTAVSAVPSPSRSNPQGSVSAEFRPGSGDEGDPAPAVSPAKPVRPVISVEDLRPQDRAVVTKQVMPLAGRVTGDHGEKILVDGDVVRLQWDGSFQTTVWLEEGLNQVTVEAGEEAFRYAFILDTQRPVVSVASPQPGSVTNTATATVIGTAQDSTLRYVAVNGREVRFAEGGAFKVPVKLTPGSNTVNVVARDGTGQETYATFKVVLDQRPPEIETEHPLSVPYEQVAMRVSANEPLSKLVVAGESVDPANERTWSLVVPAGDVPITAVDQAGNVTSHFARIERFYVDLIRVLENESGAHLRLFRRVGGEWAAEDLGPTKTLDVVKGTECELRKVRPGVAYLRHRLTGKDFTVPLETNDPVLVQLRKQELQRAQERRELARRRREEMAKEAARKKELRRVKRGLARLQRSYDRAASNHAKYMARVQKVRGAISAYEQALPGLEAAERQRVAAVQLEISRVDARITGHEQRLTIVRSIRPINRVEESAILRQIESERRRRTELEKDAVYRDPRLRLVTLNSQLRQEEAKLQAAARELAQLLLDINSSRIRINELEAAEDKSSDW